MPPAAPPPAHYAPAPPPSPLATASPLGAPWIATPRPGMNAADWLARHDAFVARAKLGRIDVLFLGDSITDFFATRGEDAWNRAIVPLGSVANFGISGDRTQYLLWRVRNGELDGSGARVVVVMIGTNNLGAATPAGVARGVGAVVAVVRAKLPHAVVILNALLPRAEPDDPMRAKVTEVNARIARFADGKHVRWLDAGAGFVDVAGCIPPELMPDGLHPSAAGYEVWAAALAPVLAGALSK